MPGTQKVLHVEMLEVRNGAQKATGATLPYRWGNRHPERYTDLPKVTWLGVKDSGRNKNP